MSAPVVAVRLRALGDLVLSTAAFRSLAAELFELIRQGVLKTTAIRNYALADVARTEPFVEACREVPVVDPVAAPIRDSTGRVIAALSVAFPKYLDAGLTLHSVEPLVTAAALRVSRTPSRKALSETNASAKPGTLRRRKSASRLLTSSA